MRVMDIANNNLKSTQRQEIKTLALNIISIRLNRLAG